MAGKPSPITRAVLAWAISEDGRSLLDLANALGIDEALLDEWVEGESLPTVGQVTDLAATLRRPRAMFFMPKPPESATLPPSFRHPPGDERLVSAAARRSLRQARRMQTVISGAIEDGPPVEVPRYRLAQSPEVAAAQMREWLGVSLADQTQWASDYQALYAWRAAMDARGIFVFALDIGETSNGRGPRVSGVVSDEIRGFSAWDERAPLIVMNSRRVSPAARSFTLGHELGHLVTRVDAACLEPTTLAPFQ